MERNEFAVWAAALQTYYPKEKLLPNKQAMELWYRALRDIPFNVLELALNKWIATEKWSPSIAEIREKSAEIMIGARGDWGEGWKQVLDAVRYYGQYRPLAALESMDEVTRECVERLGFLEICRTENMAVERANFRQLYEQTAAKRLKEAQTPKELTDLIERITQENYARLAGE